MITETTVAGDDGVDATPSGLHILVMSPETFSSHELPPSGSVVIGRSSKCAIRMEDPLASREHARLHIEASTGAAVLKIEDLRSANGTRVREAVIPAGEPTPIVPGEGVIIGATVIMVLQDRSPSGLSRLWSHGYFGARVSDECLHAARAKTSFAVARIRFTGAAPWTKVAPILARNLGSRHGVAIYGPKDYEIVFLEPNETSVEALLSGMLDGFRAERLEPRGALAWYPRHGRTYDALLGYANAALTDRSGARVEPELPAATRMRRVHELVRKAAPSTINVLIRGETGVGKDVLAQLIHRTSPRSAKPLVVLNCAGLPETLLESELFGHLKGTFTGAAQTKVGILESADGGTVFLDEIGDMPSGLQVKLLRVIDNREILPIGALRPKTINVRFIAATNKDLEAAVAKNEFREDLLFRLNGITLDIPPLRERRDEIPALVQIFLAGGARQMGRDPAPSINQSALASLVEHEWKGNIRELKNVIERAVVLCDGPEVLPEHLELRPGTTSRAAGDVTRALPVLTDLTKLAERQKIVDALEACAWSQTRASQLLGMPRRTFVSKLDYYKIPRPQKVGFRSESTKTAVKPATNGGAEPS